MWRFQARWDYFKTFMSVSFIVILFNALSLVSFPSSWGVLWWICCSELIVKLNLLDNSSRIMKEEAGFICERTLLLFEVRSFQFLNTHQCCFLMLDRLFLWCSLWWLKLNNVLLSTRGLFLFGQRNSRFLFLLFQSTWLFVLFCHLQLHFSAIVWPKCLSTLSIGILWVP